MFRNHQMAIILLLFCFSISLSASVDRRNQPQAHAPTYLDIQKQVESAFPSFYRGATVSDMVDFQVNEITNGWDTRLDGKPKKIWSIKATAVSSNKMTAYFTGTISFRPEEANGRKWRCKLRDRLSPLTDEMTR